MDLFAESSRRKRSSMTDIKGFMEEMFDESLVGIHYRKLGLAKVELRVHETF